MQLVSRDIFNEDAVVSVKVIGSVVKWVARGSTWQLFGLSEKRRLEMDNN